MKDDDEGSGYPGLVRPIYICICNCIFFVFVAVFVFVFVCICEDEDQGSGYPGLVRPLRRFTATNLPARGPRALLLLLLLEVIMDPWCHLAILKSSNPALGPRALLQVSNWRSSGHLASSHLLVTIDHTVIQENLFWGVSLLELATHPFFPMCIDAHCAYLHIYTYSRIYTLI